MKPLWVLIVREFTTRLAKKGFWFFTVFSLAIMIALTFMPTIQHYVERKSMTSVIVNDPLHIVSSRVESIAQDMNSPYAFRVSVTDETNLAELDTTEMLRFMKDHHTKLVVMVSQSKDEQIAFTIDKNGTFDNATISSLENLLKTSVSEARMASLSPQIIKQLNAPIQFQTHQLQLDAKSGANFTESKMLVYFLVILLFTSLISFGAWVAQGVIEEKSNRIVEMMLIAVKPWQILFGKIIGIGLVGTIQCILLLAGMAASLHLQNNYSVVSVQGVSTSTILFFPVFFVLGYFTYATLFGISGSLVNRAEDQQMAVTPVTLLLVLLFYGSLFGLINPSSTFTVVLSFMPFEPMAMFTRVALSVVPVWQIVIAIIEEVMIVMGLTFLGAKIYRKFALHTTGRGGFGLLLLRHNRSNGVKVDS